MHRLLAFCVCVTLSSFTVEVTGVCPNGWTKYDNSCYSLFTNKHSWQYAKAFCIEFGSQLATLNTKTKNDKAKEFLNYLRLNESVWIGANDLHKEGAWVWDSDQKAVTFKDWAPTEPNQTSDHEQDCVVMYSYHGFQWADSGCAVKHNYLCEKQSVPQ
ncbi:C-type lectin BML-2-like [Haliotis cracherodii]|uniref:C-type lectin BML-2-like n=1 Tax=Haliotis cracherodii TaxID=6455 RepID=UPI0039EBE464